MIKRARRKHTTAFKTKVALAALSGEKTLADLVQQLSAPFKTGEEKDTR